MSKKNNIFKVLSLLLIAILSFGLIACGETDKEIAAKVDAQIEELPLEVGLDDELDLLDVREAYDALTAEQKELVTKLADLVAKENKYLDLKAADGVITKISVLPANLVLAHKTLVTQARADYDKLTATQKALVSNLAKLTAAEEVILDLEAQKADQDAAKVVENLISALPSTGTVELEDEEDIVAARAAYDVLTADQKALIPNLNKLTNAETELDEAKADFKREEDKAAAGVVDTQIASLPILVLLSDKPTIQAARAAYEALSTDQKVFVINLAHLVTKETRIANLELAKPVDDAIVALPEVVTVNDEAAILAARAAYDGLTEAAKTLITQLDRLVNKEDELLVAKNPDLGVIFLATKNMPSQIVNDYQLPTADGAITWAYKESSDTSYFDIETGQMLKTTFGTAKSILVATKGEATKEFEINFGLVNDGQTTVFYTGLVVPTEGNTWDGFGTYETQLEKAGFGGATIVVGDKVFFVGKNSYIPLSGTTENEKLSRETLRPHGLAEATSVNNNGMEKGVPKGYTGAGVLYHNTGDVAITFDASDTYGRANNPNLGFTKVPFSLVDGKLIVQLGLGDHSGPLTNDSVGSTDLLTVTLQPGDFLWTVHGWEVDYGTAGHGTHLNQNHQGILNVGIEVKVNIYKYIEEVVEE